MAELGLKPILTFYRCVGLTKAFSLQNLSLQSTSTWGYCKMQWDRSRFQHLVFSKNQSSGHLIRIHKDTAFFF